MVMRYLVKSTVAREIFVKARKKYGQLFSTTFSISTEGNKENKSIHARIVPLDNGCDISNFGRVHSTTVLMSPLAGQIDDD